MISCDKEMCMINSQIRASREHHKMIKQLDAIFKERVADHTQFGMQLKANRAKRNVTPDLGGGVSPMT